MPSAFELCLVRLQATHEGSGLESLVDYLSIGSASSIRSASRTLYGLREVEKKAFQTVYIPTPPNQKQCVGDLGNVGQYCNHLIIRIAFATQATKKKPTGQTIQDFLAKPRHQQAHEARLISRHSQQNSTPKIPVAWKFFLQRRPSEINQALLKQWLLVFSLFPNITTLTIACNGDPAWPGCTDIEMLLIVLRICIERTNPASLRTICLNPIHAMGIMHFRPGQVRVPMARPPGRVIMCGRESSRWTFESSIRSYRSDCQSLNNKSSGKCYTSTFKVSAAK